MQPLGVVGDGADEFIVRFATQLDGRVATVEHHSEITDGQCNSAGPAASYALTDTGTWTAHGEQRSLPELLDDLAPEYEYVLAAGFPAARLPTVLLGEASADDVRGDILLTTDSVDDVDFDALAESVGDLDPHVTLESLVARAKDSPKADRAGAIATLTGRVRARDAPDDDPTEYLKFEKYAGVAQQRLTDIETELTDRAGVFEVLMHHRVGVIEDGEDIVFVVVLAGHREEAFRTVEDGINRLKDEVPIFKKETTTDEEFWVHERS
jgi:molybdopterin synthase catalytic subunit